MIIKTINIWRKYTNNKNYHTHFHSFFIHLFFYFSNNYVSIQNLIFFFSNSKVFQFLYCRLLFIFIIPQLHCTDIHFNLLVQLHISYITIFRYPSFIYFQLFYSMILLYKYTSDTLIFLFLFYLYFIYLIFICLHSFNLMF